LIPNLTSNEQTTNVLIDDEIFIRQRFGGVSRIFIEILKAAPTFPNFKINFSNTYSENEYLQEAQLSKLKPFLKELNFPLKGKLTRFIIGGMSHIRTRQLLKKSGIKIFHPSFYSDYFFESLPQQTKLVFTLHDLTHEKNNDALATIKERNLKRADHIIVVSSQTKEEMEYFYPFTKSKTVSIIHLAQNLPLQSQIVPHLPAKFILFVGERGAYKNFEVVLNAFKILVQKEPGLNLVCCGGQNFSKSEKLQFKGADVSKQVLHFKLNDAQLKYVYEKAEAFIYPSLSEGFGIPVLEAMSCQTPTLLSNIPIFKEVADKAALFFEPHNAQELAQQIEIIRTNTLVQTELKELASQRIKLFSWEKHISKTYQVYNSLCP